MYGRLEITEKEKNGLTGLVYLGCPGMHRGGSNGSIIVSCPSESVTGVNGI